MADVRGLGRVRAPRAANPMTWGRWRRGSLGRAVAVVGLVLLFAVACDTWPSSRGGPELSGFNSSERSIDPTNVTSLLEDFTSTNLSGVVGSPVVSDGVVYATTSNPDQLVAFDANGVANCSGSPKRCAALWRAPLPRWVADPIVSGGLVYSVTGGGLFAFAGGTGSGCATEGVQHTKVCSPRWQSTASTNLGTPTIAGGVLYVADLSATPALQAFDAAGTTNCGGTPRTCSPLWTVPGSWGVTSPTVANGYVYATPHKTGAVTAFDAAGIKNCSGSPKTCSPLWSTVSHVGPNGTGAIGSPVVGGYIVQYREDSSLAVYDAHGTTNCSGTPALCQPLWTAATGPQQAASMVAVAYGNIYVPAYQHIDVFDLGGTTNCAGTPKVCTPLRSVTSPAMGGGIAVASSVTIANGVGYIGVKNLNSSGGRLIAFDAQDTASCAGQPLTCPILWSQDFSGAPDSTPAVADGRIYIGTLDGLLHAYHLPS